MAKSREETRQRRKLHIRKKLFGTQERPRVFVVKSNKYIELGVANDTEDKVLFSVKGPKSSDEVTKLVKEFLKKLKAKKIDTVVFDRSGYKYTGVVKKIADDMREAGIKV